MFRCVGLSSSYAWWQALGATMADHAPPMASGRASCADLHASSGSVQILIFLALGYAIAMLARAVIRERDLLPILMLVGFVVLAAGVAWDVIRLRRPVQALQATTQYGLMGFVVAQSTVLAILNRRRGRELEQRNREVQQLNEDLRDQIAHRSHELSHAHALVASPKPAAQDLAPGTVIAEKYRIGALLGEGGMGKVYRAERVADGRAVARYSRMPVGFSKSYWLYMPTVWVIGSRLRSPCPKSLLFVFRDQDRTHGVHPAAASCRAAMCSRRMVPLRSGPSRPDLLRR